MNEYEQKQSPHILSAIEFVSIIGGNIDSVINLFPLQYQEQSNTIENIVNYLQNGEKIKGELLMN